MGALMALCLMIPGACDDTALEHLAELPITFVQAGEVERWRPLIEAVFPADEVETALCIVRYESGGDPEADNPRSTAQGLFQVLGSLWGPHYGVAQAELNDPTINTHIAADIWDRHGWWAWSPYQRGACRRL